MGTKSRWFSVLEISWLPLLLLASPLLPADYGNWFRNTDSGLTSFSWPDQMMREVIAIANASGSSSSICDRMSNCSSGFHPLVEDQNLPYFKAMGSNKPCSCSRGNNGTCTTVTLNYERSYISITPDPTLGSTLSKNFVSMEFSYVFFGSTNRTWRGFPGQDEENGDLNCTKLNSHLRPLYLTGIYPMKQLKILIDTGNSTGAPVTAEFNRAPGTIYLNVAQEITSEFLKTLTPRDMVDVFSFNATGAHPLNSQVKGKSHGAKNSSDLSELSRCQLTLPMHTSPQASTDQTYLQQFWTLSQHFNWINHH